MPHHYPRTATVLVALLLSWLAAPAQTRFKSLNYLYGITGSRTVSGEHNRQPIATPTTYTDRINAITGDYPGLWSSDFLFEQSEINNRGTMINAAKAQWANGALINIMFHACPPTQAEPCQWQGGVVSTLTDAQWSDLVTDGGQLNRNWKARLDVIVPYLQDLKNNGVEVMFRPFHEMNQPIFWWAGRPGANGTARLFRLTRDYLVNVKGLTNLIWVWDLQDFSTLSSDLASYNPGAAYWDVLALDMYYSDGQGYTTAKYNAMLNAAGNKPIAIGECEVLPSSALLAAQPRWAFFMGWSELVFNSNSNSTIQNVFWAGNVLVRDEMPGWNNVPNPVAPNLAYQRPVTVTSTEPNSTNTADKAVDANGTTRWSSAYANNQSIYVDLGATYNVNRVRLAWESAYARDYQVQVSTNGTTWTTIKDVWNKTSASADDHTGLNATARYVKVYCINRATSYGFSLYELEVYGTGTGARSAITASSAAAAAQPGQSLSVFPNPFTDQVTVHVAAEWLPSGFLLVIDGKGRVVRREQLRREDHTIDLAQLPSGIYQVALADNTRRISQTIVKH